MTLPSADDIAKRLDKKSAHVQEFLSSTIGKAVIELLEEEFDPDVLIDTDPHITYYNLGRRDVVVYLKQLSRWKSNDGLKPT